MVQTTVTTRGLNTKFLASQVNFCMLLFKIRHSFATQNNHIKICAYLNYLKGVKANGITPG